ncbi:TetR/AcrR family transcriptional regulator [Maribacter algicola]|uniref:TetR/AcrR family transcriptional regulator n=1 Tax=Meishania litoralis TaxID=3434685 RepID=A0ACC7LLY3_9FLAO
MSETKQKILLQSLKLFNARGVSKVSLRTISDALNISVGNLQYHFKKREDIIEELYFQLVKKIDDILVVNEGDLLNSFFSTSKQMISMLYEYHFFLLDFVTIVRNNQKIKHHYAKLSKQREEQFLMLVELMIKRRVLREELLKNEYKMLFKRIEVISNFWFSSVYIQSSTLSERVLEDYSLIVGQSIFPYLTEEGNKQFALIFPNEIV